MRFRKLRIVFSATCLIACVLLIVLWVRSYWWNDLILVDHYPRIVQLESMRGRLHYIDSDRARRPRPQTVTYIHQWIADQPPASWKRNTDLISWSFMRTDSDFVRPTKVTTVPTWFAALVIFAVATVPWFRWRFTLRTLLIATTLIAVVLGIIVWLGR